MRLRTRVIDRDPTPLGELVLERYESDVGEVGYQVSIDGRFLMGAHGCHSERALGPLAHARMRRPAADLSVLVGGLGAGHTLRAALDLPGVVRVVVAEIGARVADWNRLYFAPFNGHAVDDPRVVVRVADLADVLAGSARDGGGAWDLMLLDVDNGPGWLAAPGNARLYDVAGVRTCRDALRPGGAVAVWSPARNPAFLATFREVFPDAEEIDTAPLAREAGEIRDIVYVGVRAGNS